MSGYVVTLVYEVGDVDPSVLRDVMAGWWASGREFSLLEPPLLTLVAEVEAPGRPDAFEAALAQAELVWSVRACGTLPPPRIARVEPVTVPAAASRGPVGRGPDRILAEALAGRAACLRAAAAALVELERESAELC